MVRRGTLWAALLQSFNDPFDCTCAILDENKQHTMRVMREFVNDQMGIVRREVAGRRRDRFGFSRTLMRDLLKQFERAKANDEAIAALFHRLDHILPEAWRAFVPAHARQLLEQTLNTVGVVSLSARRDSLLMWAHYADSHRGYCLGFDQAQFVKHALCRPVIYSRAFPDVKLQNVAFRRKFKLGRGLGRHHRMADSAMTSIPFNDETLLHVIYAKAEHWAYEQEWRVLVEQGGVEIPYPAPLREVIFGVRCSPELKGVIIRAVPAGGGDDVQFIQAEAVPGEFGLAFKREGTAA
jgi:hypothetical protein